MRRMHFLAALLMPLPCVTAGAQARCTLTADEPFVRFFDAFSRDKAFAMTRTVYPLVLLLHPMADDDEVLGNQIVEKRLAQGDDARMEALAPYARDNGLQLSTASLSRTEATVRMEKPDTDWLLTYHFVREGRCWTLRRIEDHSM